jgi:hypothetical protein
MLCAEISESRMATKARPGRAAQQVHDAEHDQHQDEEHQIVEALVAVDGQAEDLEAAEHLAGVAAGDVLGAGDALLDDEAEGQRGDGEVHALHAQRRQADDDAGDAGHQRREGERNGEGPAELLQVGLGVGAHGEEGGMAERDLAGEADQDHQADAGDRIDPDEDQLRDPVVGQQPRGGGEREQQRAVPEYLAAMLEQADVLLVIGLEEKAHD